MGGEKPSHNRLLFIVSIKRKKSTLKPKGTLGDLVNRGVKWKRRREIQSKKILKTF